MQTNLSIFFMLCIGFFVTSILPGVVRADNTERARLLFSEGKNAFSDGDFAEAAEYFRQAYQLKPSWKLRYNLAQAEVAAKQYDLALEEFENYLAEGGDDIDQSRSQDVMNEINRLRMLVGTVTLEVPDGTVLYVNGVQRGKTPLKSVVRVAIGMQQVRLVLDGKEILNDRFKFTGGEATLISVDASGNTTAAAVEDESLNDGSSVQDESTTVADNPAKRPEQEQASPLKPVGWTLVSVGLGAVAGGVVTGAMALSKANNLESACPDQQCTDPANEDEISASKTLGRISTVLYAAGGAVAVTGIVLLAVNKKRHREAAAFSVAPVVTQNLQGIFFSGRF